MAKYLSKMALHSPSGGKNAPDALVRWPQLTPVVRNAKGQLTIFFAVTLVMVITVTAFIINVGMYVKAKINLQNAVDAAAWSGAAVQARQLTDIGYLNWEMRNTYKEWMFKYYVLGGISLDQVRNPPGSGNMNFRMQQFGGAGAADPYAFPSVCLDLAAGSNICKIYQVPGLPRFPPSGNIGTDQTSQAFLDAIASKKNEDCSQRSRLNVATLAQWTYAAEGSELSAAPMLVGKRPGAYLKALEIAMRIRNLERQVNEAPQTVCTSGCAQEYSSWYNSKPAGPYKERTVKAYWAAMRNLGLQDNNNETPKDFTLTEIAPSTSNQVNQKDEYSLSYLLIPKSKFSSFQKYYLDLKIYLLNFAPFYTAFIAEQQTNTAGVTEEAKCGASKMAMPVPGYPLGFEKNPNILTYYAVKGESTFMGLLNPFSQPPKLVAYAAAKPFGGRIGPRLFKTYKNGTDQVLKVNVNPPRSNQYVIGMNLKTRSTDPTNKPFIAGDAIPFNSASKFWVDDTGGDTPIGGWTEKDTQFVLPNMVYEYFPGSMPSAGTDPVQVVQASGTGVATTYNDPVGGLFDARQYTAFRSNLGPAGSGYGSNEIVQAIENARAPTRYDAYNYLIPTYIQPSENLDSFQIANPNLAAGIGSSPDQLHEFKIYAPFYADGTHFLYNNQAEVTETIKSFIQANEPALNKYRLAMKDVAQSIMNSGLGSAAANIYATAANQIYAEVDGKIACQSVAGDFITFYMGLAAGQVGGIGLNPPNPDIDDALKDPKDCPHSLLESFTDYLSKFTGEQISYVGYMKYPESNAGWTDPMKFLTAWMPGVRQGAQNDNSGRLLNPFSASTGEIIAKRNFYSTKFVSLDSLTNSGHYISGDFPRYIEKDSKTEGDEQAVNFIQLDSGNITQ